MKGFKKAISLAVLAVFVFTSVPFNAFAAEDPSAAEDIKTPEVQEEDPHGIASIEMKTSTFANSATTRDLEDSIVITRNDKSVLGKDCFLIRTEGSSAKDLGEHKMSLILLGEYSDYEPVELRYTVVPAAPTSFYCHYVQPSDPTKVDVRVSQNNFAGIEKVRFSISQHSNMSGARIVTMNHAPNCRYLITGLRKNSTYYITAQNVGSNARGKEYVSAPSEVLTLNTVNDYYPAPTLKNTKALYAKMKAGKPFTIKMRVTEKVARDYMDKLWQMYPYYRSLGNQTVYYYALYGEQPGSVFTVECIPNTSGMAKARACQKKVNKIVSKARKKKSNVQKVKYVNNRIKSMCRYSKKAPYRYDAYGCLMQGKAVCAGYTDTFTWCMNDLGIKNTVQYNKRRTHIWNKVYIKYKRKTRWWHVDVTWNDGKKRNKYLLTKSHRNS